MRKESKRSRPPAGGAVSVPRPRTTRRSTAQHAQLKQQPTSKSAGLEAGTTGNPITQSASSLHQLFEQQTRQMLDRIDLDEEQKQNILIAMSCPCCGAGAMSYTVKLRR
jgi:hypothetical protein